VADFSKTRFGLGWRVPTIPIVEGWSRGSPEWLTIVGVVANTPIFGLAEANPFPTVVYADIRFPQREHGAAS
jgi:hypothetical protein